MEITTTKEKLFNDLESHFLNEFKLSLEQTDLDQEEKNANLVLAKKKIKKDAEGIMELVFKVSV